MIRAFCGALEKAGYWVGLYTSRSVLTTHIEDDIKNRYAIWAAEWGAKLNYSGSVGIWQYSDKGRVDGITGAVDLDEGYIDYAKLVKERGLNGFSAAVTTAAPADTQKTAAVILQIGDDIYKGTLTKA
jgi:GH25 family lysozyme M1 (1,4-beta-N-acetylmuramidase)